MDEITKETGSEDPTNAPPRPVPSPTTRIPLDDHDFDRRVEQQVQELLFSQDLATRIGRYLILGHIGRGGMGRVYSAYDEQLDRKVAIKVLLDDELPGEGVRHRFRREAQALARLSHPNIVTVYEVSETDEQLFIAMEFIRGRSLNEWLDTEPGWPVVLDAFLQAGRGLIAAHDAGLIHRDLKPSNLMRSEDGTVKILDFGLARVVDDEHDPLDELVESMEGSVSRRSLDSSPSAKIPLTVPGTVMGTPAYMSPEQLRGEPADARSDQFSFCVALFEALYGARPWRKATTIAAHLHSIERGVVLDHVSSAKVPAAIHRALIRGLDPDPEKRWASMQLLVEALSHDPKRRRRSWVLAGATLTLAGVLASMGNTEIEPCTGASDKLAGVWDEARRTEVQTAMHAVEGTFADKAWDRARVELDAYADDWITMHTEACEATTIRGEQSMQLLDLRMACLQRASDELRTAVDTLAEGGEKVVRNVDRITSELWSLSRCADAETLISGVTPPPVAVADTVASARTELALARNLGWAGRYDAAERALDTAEELVDETDYGPLQTELAMARGQYFEMRNDGNAAERALSKGLRLAMRWRQWDLLGEAAHRLLYVVGALLERPEEGLHYLALAQEGEKDSPLHVAATHHNMGSILNAQGKYDEAEVEFRAGLALALDTVGPEHIRVATLRNNFASFLSTRRELDEAEDQVRTALAMGMERLGEDHLTVVQSRAILARILASRGRPEDAEVEVMAAITAARKTLDPSNDRMADLRMLRCGLLIKQGKLEEAEQEYRAVLAIMVELYGAEHRKTANVRISLGNLLHNMGKLQEAEQQLAAAIEALAAILEPDHPMLARARLTLAYIMAEAGRYADALEMGEHAWKRIQRPDMEYLQGDNALLIAQLSWEVEGSSAQARRRAHVMAEKALSSFGKQVEFPDAVDEVEQWIEDHPLE